MLKVGLTGGIGSGKTAVSDLFNDLDVPVIDTDIIARSLVNDNPAVLKEITSLFGQKVINKDGELNRKNLAQIVFNDSVKKQQLEQILHPKIRNQVEQQLLHLQKNERQRSEVGNYCIIVIPLLFESGDSETDYHGLIDRNLVVVADLDHRIQRVSERDNRLLDEIHAIIKTQVDDETRINNADDVLDNNNDIKTLQTQILALDTKYRNLAKVAQ